MSGWGWDNRIWPINLPAFQALSLPPCECLQCMEDLQHFAAVYPRRPAGWKEVLKDRHSSSNCSFWLLVFVLRRAAAVAFPSGLAFPSLCTSDVLHYTFPSAPCGTAPAQWLMGAGVQHNWRAPGGEGCSRLSSLAAGFWLERQHRMLCLPSTLAWAERNSPPTLSCYLQYSPTGVLVFKMK